MRPESRLLAMPLVLSLFVPMALLSGVGKASLPPAVPALQAGTPETRKVSACHTLFETRSDIRSGAEKLLSQPLGPEHTPIVLASDLGYAPDESPRWLLSPDCETVFFVEKKGTVSALYSSRRDGAHKTRLTPAGVKDVRGLTFDSGARRLYFTVDDQVIGSVDADGSHYRVLPYHSEGGLWNLSLSPDGKYVVFKTVEGPGKLVSVETATGRAITLDNGDGDPNGCRNYAYSFLRGDGRLLFQCLHAEAPLDEVGFRNLFTIRPDGTGRANLYPEAESSVARVAETPDRARVIYQLGGDGGLYSVACDGTRRLRLDEEADPAQSFRLGTDRVAWLSASGKLVARRFDGSLSQTLRAAGTATPGDGHLEVISFGWSADGSRLGYLAHEGAKSHAPARLMIVGLDGKPARPLFPPAASGAATVAPLDAWWLGERILYTERQKNGRLALATVDFDGRHREALGTVGPPAELQLSNDGAFLLWKEEAAARSSGLRYLLVPLDGSGGSELKVSDLTDIELGGGKALLDD